MEKSLELLTTPASSVLFRSEGGVIKTPFNFGLGLKSTNIKIEINLSAIPSGNDVTIIEFHNRVESEVGCAVVSFADGKSVTTSIFAGFGGNLYASGSAVSASYVPGIASSPRNALATIIKKSPQQFKLRTPSGIGAIALNTSAGVLKYTSSGGRNGTLGVGNALNYISVFTREITKEEFTALWGNGNGGFHITDTDLFSVLNALYPEVLDFSTAQDGSDMRVGFRDLTGNNNHGKILSLPVGTHSQQILYVLNQLYSFNG